MPRNDTIFALVTPSGRPGILDIERVHVDAGDWAAYGEGEGIARVPASLRPGDSVLEQNVDFAVDWCDLPADRD